MRKIIFLIVALVFVSCNTADKKPVVFSEVITKDNLGQIAEKITSDNTISSEQINVINRGLTRLAVNGNDTLVGLSIGEIYEFQNGFSKEQAISAMGQNIDKISLILNHSFKYIGLVPRQDSLDFMVYEITNKSDKDIKNLTGVLQFYNAKNQLVKQYPLRADVALKKDELIKSGETKRISLPYVHNKDNLRDSIMRYSQNNLRTLWQPRGILFSDDTKITVNDK